MSRVPPMVLRKTLEEEKRSNSAGRISRGGNGVRVRVLPGGREIVSMKSRTFGWDSPFAVRLLGDSVFINPGQLNGKTPTINGIPLGPLGPLLKLDAGIQGVSSYIALAVTNGPASSTDPTTTIQSIEVVNVQFIGKSATDNFFGGALGYPDFKGNTRYPLAMINNWQFGKATVQVCWHNIAYKPVLTPQKAMRHYFYPTG